MWNDSSLLRERYYSRAMGALHLYSTHSKWPASLPSLLWIWEISLRLRSFTSCANIVQKYESISSSVRTRPLTSRQIPDLPHAPTLTHTARIFSSLPPSKNPTLELNPLKPFDARPLSFVESLCVLLSPFISPTAFVGLERCIAWNAGLDGVLQTVTTMYREVENGLYLVGRTLLLLLPGPARVLLSYDLKTYFHSTEKENYWVAGWKGCLTGNGNQADSREKSCSQISCCFVSLHFLRGNLSHQQPSTDVTAYSDILGNQSRVSL